MKSIYVENASNAPPTYHIGEEAVRAAIRSECCNIEIVVRDTASPDIDALARSEFFVGTALDTARIAAHGARLRMIHCTSAGVDRYMPLDWLPRSAAFTNSSGVHADKGGAFGAMAILMLNEHVPLHAHNQRLRRWEQKLATSIAGKTVLIYGLGALGAAVAARIKPFQVRVIGVRRSGQRCDFADEVHTPDAIDALLPHADFLVLTCPLTNETRRLFAAGKLAQLKRGAAVLNLARAAVMDYRALAEALSEARLSGAILDVFDEEPLPSGAPWWDVPNLLVTPHVSSDDAEGYIDRCLAIFGENFRRLKRGEALMNLVDGARGY